MRKKQIPKNQHSKPIRKVVRNPNKLPIPQHSNDHQSSIDSDDHSIIPPNQEQYQSPEDIKLKFAKKLLQTTKNSVRNNNKIIKEDGFFMTDDQDKEQQIVTQTLKNQYMMGRNRLYRDLSSNFMGNKISTQPQVRYKGHTRCITGMQATAEQIFSCSKDRSVIRWDRQTGKKDFITRGDSEIVQGDHVGPILSISYHPGYSLLATGAEDGLIKLWDARTCKLIETLKGHRQAVNGVKFGNNSNNLCSVSGDRTFKQWDCAQRGLIQTFYGHNSQVLDIDCINGNDFLSSGNDHQSIIWKTEKETQLIFNGHDYAIDRIRAINEQKFVTGCQDGSIYLWSNKKKKPIYKNSTAHEQAWITSLSTVRQANILASGDTKGIIKIWSIHEEMKGMSVIGEIQSGGIINDLEVNNKQIIAAVGDQCRLGRWWTKRVRNQIQVYKVINQ